METNNVNPVETVESAGTAAGNPLISEKHRYDDQLTGDQVRIREDENENQEDEWSDVDDKEVSKENSLDIKPYLFGLIIALVLAASFSMPANAQTSPSRTPPAANYPDNRVNYNYLGLLGLLGLYGLHKNRKRNQMQATGVLFALKTMRKT